MATEYYSGTSGRVKGITISPVLTTDEVTWAGDPATLVEVDSWEITWEVDGGAPESVTFESESDSEGHLYPEVHRGGIARWSGTMNCLVNGDTSNSFETLPNGCFFYADYLFQKGSGDGFENCKCKMTSRPIKTGVREKMATYSIRFTGSGALPAPTM